MGKLTNDEIEQILDAKEFEGIATHYDDMWGYLHYDTRCLYFDEEYWTELEATPKNIHDISDIREILELRKEVDRFRKLLKDVQIEGGLSIGTHRRIDRAIKGEWRIL